jgi:hypothetical protein
MRLYSGYKKKSYAFFKRLFLFLLKCTLPLFKSMTIVNRVVIFVIMFGYVGTLHLTLSPFCFRSRYTSVNTGFDCGLWKMLEEVNALIFIIIQEGDK